MVKYPRTLFALDRRPDNKRPTTLGMLLWFACWLRIRGGSVRLCCRAACGLCAVCTSPDVMLLT